MLNRIHVHHVSTNLNSVKPQSNAMNSLPEKMSFFARSCHCTSLTQPWRTVKKLTQEALLGQELLGWKKKDEKQKEKN